MYLNWLIFIKLFNLNLFRFVFLMALFQTETVAENKSVLLEFDSRVFPTVSNAGMVASQESQATEVGVNILEQGGNAIDAAVAVGFTLAVTLPRAGNIGGGGFMMIYDSRKNQVNALDYREVAPAKAERDMFLDENFDLDNKKARYSLLASAVPGTVAGLIEAHKKYGRLPLKEVMLPAINLAKELTLTRAMAQALNVSQWHLKKDEESRKIFVKPDKSYWQVGDLFEQIELSVTLERIANSEGRDFYQGETAKIIADYFQQNGGLIGLSDLKTYQPIWREPVSVDFENYQIFSMPPPSSGGIHLIQLFNIISQFPVDHGGANSAFNTHIKVEAMKFAYADRSKYLGDPDFAKVPVDQLISVDYAKKIAAKISLQAALSSSQVKPGQMIDLESPQTTHFSVMDNEGNIVSNTYTLNFSYGSGKTVPGTGMLLNNQMDDFSAKAGLPNGYGLLGGKANSIEPYKRPLSSMTPVIVLKDSKPWLATGSPGGSKIISSVFNFLLNRILHSMNIAEASMLPRVHHQWFPDVLKVEKGFPIDSAKILKKMGHNIVYSKPWGSLQSIEYSQGLYFGYSDTRRPGALAKGLNKNPSKPIIKDKTQ